MAKKMRSLIGRILSEVGRPEMLKSGYMFDNKNF